MSDRPADGTVRATLAQPPELRHLFTMTARLATPLDGGEGVQGRRTLNSIASGSFEGDRLRGRLNPGTGDWMLTRGELRVVDARVVLVADDGAVIHMFYGGRIDFSGVDDPRLADARRRHEVDPASYYFRTTPTFETGAPHYAWLNRVVAVGVGRLIDGGVTYEIHEVA